MEKHIESFSQALQLILPIVMSTTLHMVFVKKNWFSGLNRPIHSGLFGANKTIRGLFLMPLLSILAQWIFSRLPVFAALTSEQTTFLGLWVGLAYVVFELPNSFIKRRLGIAPGKQPEKCRWLAFLVDRLDSVLGCAIVYNHILVEGKLVPLSSVLLIFLVGPLVHYFATGLLFALGIRKNRH